MVVFVSWCLTPLSTIFQLYPGGQFYRGRKPGDPKKNHRPVTSHWQTLSHNVVHLALIGIRTHNISADCIGSCKSNYHIITAIDTVELQDNNSDFNIWTTHGPSWSWSYGSWIYLCNQCLSQLKLWVRIPRIARCTRYSFMC